MEQLEATPILHTQEVRGSSPCAPTICFKSLRIAPNPQGRRILTQSACFFPRNGPLCQNPRAFGSLAISTG